MPDGFMIEHYADGKSLIIVPKEWYLILSPGDLVNEDKPTEFEDASNEVSCFFSSNKLEKFAKSSPIGLGYMGT